jgi:high-affinity Fe2+/Pb2+ permease
MKHIQAGLVVGGVVAAALGITLVVWRILSSILGEGISTVLFGIVLAVMVISAVVDWMTEKKGA